MPIKESDKWYKQHNIYALNTDLKFPFKFHCQGERQAEPPMTALTGGLGIMRLLLRKCGISTEGQMCSFLLGALWQVGSWQGSVAISLFINPCLLTLTLTAGVIPTVALALWVVLFLAQSKVTHISSTTHQNWETQLLKHWLWLMY